MAPRLRRLPRGRAVLGWGLVVFFAVQLGASVLFDYCWPQVRFPMQQQTIARMGTFAPAPTILFLGSSRTGCVVAETQVTDVVRGLTGDPAVQCFNAAVPAGDPILCERMLRDLLAQGARPRYAVIEVCPEGVNHRNGWLTMYVAWFLCWHDLPAFCKDLVVTNNLVRFAGTRVLPLYVYRHEVRQQLAKAAVDCYEGQGVPAAAMPTTASARRTDGPELWQRIVTSLRASKDNPQQSTTAGIDGVQRWVRDYRPGGNAAARLERLLQQCRDHDIEPILLSVPLSSAHRAQYTPEIEAAFQSYVGRLTQEYSCRYFDYRQAVPDAYFRDHHHAASEGATLFGQIFGLEVLAPLWSGERPHGSRGPLTAERRP